METAHRFSTAQRQPAPRTSTTNTTDEWRPHRARCLYTPAHPLSTTQRAKTLWSGRRVRHSTRNEHALVGGADGQRVARECSTAKNIDEQERSAARRERPGSFENVPCAGRVTATSFEYVRRRVTATVFWRIQDGAMFYSSARGSYCASQHKCKPSWQGRTF